jgi:hypothetical protein
MRYLVMLVGLCFANVCLAGFITPQVTSISPTSGPAGGGTTVTVTGLNFTGATSVNFGRTAAASFTVNSNTQITAASPPGTGTADVTVTNPAGTSATTPADQFTYAATPVTLQEFGVK